MENRIAQWLCRTKDVRRSAFVWNLVSASLSSFQTMILLFVLTRWGNSTDSGMLVMAYSVGNLMLNIGRFGMRQYQVTDAGEVFSFRQYVCSRYCSMAVMAAATVLYLVWGAAGKGYSADKLWVVGLLCAFKGIEAAEDVFHGRMQQQGRLDVAGRILAFRFIVFILGFIACYIATRNIVLTVALNAGISLALCLLLNGAVLPRFAPRAEKKEPFRVPWKLLAQCLPLCLSMVMNIYLGNAPKYVIDGIVSDEAQTCFNIVFMPALVVALLAGFVFNPVLKRIGELWTDGKVRDLSKLAGKLALIPVALTAAAVLAGYFLGPWAFGLVYKVDVSAYRTDLVIFLLASGVIALQNLCTALITAMRKQPHLLYCFSAASLVMFLAGKPVLQAKGLTAVSLFYLAVLCAVVLYCAVVILLTLNRRQKQA